MAAEKPKPKTPPKPAPTTIVKVQNGSTKSGPTSKEGK